MGVGMVGLEGPIFDDSLWREGQDASGDAFDMSNGILIASISDPYT